MLSKTIAFLSIVRGFCHSYFLFISLRPLPEEKRSRCYFIKTTPALSFICPLWPFLLLLYRKVNFIFLGGKDYSQVWMVAVVHVNISVCSRVGIPATGACMGHPVCGYHGFLGRILLFSCW